VGNIERTHVDSDRRIEREADIDDNIDYLDKSGEIKPFRAINNLVKT
jgi:hypothetical protein